MRWNSCWGLPSSSRGRTRPARVPEFQSATGDPPFYLLSKSSPRVKAFLLTVLIMADRINVSVVGLCGTSFGSRCPAVLWTHSGHSAHSGHPRHCPQPHPRLLRAHSQNPNGAQTTCTRPTRTQINRLRSSSSLNECCLQPCTMRTWP